jgi:ABC-type multidrug transport system fused ATPase/permease subunit
MTPTESGRSGVLAPLSAVGRRLGLIVQAARLVHRMAGPHRRLLYLATGASLAVAVVEGSIVALAVPLITGVLGSTAALPAFLQPVMARLQAATRAETMLWGATWLGVGVVLRQSLGALEKALSYRASGQIVTHVRAEIVGNLLDARFRFLDHLKTGAPRQVITTESSKVIGASRALVDLSGGLFSAALLLGLAVALSAPLTAVAVGLAATAIPIKVAYARGLLRSSDANMKASLRLMNRLNEALMGIRQIKLLNRQQEFRAQIREASADSENHFRRASVLQAWEPVLLQIYGLAAILLLVHLAPTLGMASLEEAIAYVFVLYRTLPVITETNAALNRLLATWPGLQQTWRLFSMDAALREGAPGRPAPALSPESVRLVDVHFAYEEGSPVLAGASLEARKGEVVAVVGVSGAGKTSVMHLLLGMYAPASGRIVIDDRDVAELGLDTLRSTVGVVSQDLHLFNTTVVDLIRGGDGQMSVERVERAARQAEADGFIRRLPQGYQTKVGERGVRLSGGQRQRLMLAQVYARGTPIVILDEATSALDLATERQILRQLEADRGERITLVVTHRLANLADVDRIYVLESGRIVETGPWAELIARRGVFARMLERQLPEAAAEEAGR